MHTARRTRKVNGKRTDLCELLLGKAGSTSSSSISDCKHARLYSGHTRFATSSQSTKDGCHPHCWSAPTWQTYWRFVASHRGFKSTHACPSAYVTHNGDLDFYVIHGQSYTLAELQGLLPAVLHQPMPSTTDSW